ERDGEELAGERRVHRAGPAGGEGRLIEGRMGVQIGHRAPTYGLRREPSRAGALAPTTGARGLARAVEGGALAPTTTPRPDLASLHARRRRPSPRAPQASVSSPDLCSLGKTALFFYPSPLFLGPGYARSSLSCSRASLAPSRVGRCAGRPGPVRALASIAFVRFTPSLQPLFPVPSLKPRSIPSRGD